ncbi:MAG: hypothetical protein JJV99_13305 [Colwellia sp.]|nr:hypothetical protein [Colwellia sp.]
MHNLDFEKLPQELAPFIERGQTLKFASESLGVKYGTLKKLSRMAGISYPDSDELRNNYCIYTFGLSFRDFVLKLKAEKRSNRYIARQLNIQPCTLYLLAEKYGLDIKGKPYKLDEASASNINEAKIRRFRTTKTAHLLTYEGETKTLNEWAREVGLDRTALRRRIVDLNWPISEAMTIPSGQERASKKFPKLKPPKHHLIDKPSIKHSQLSQIASQYLDNYYDVVRNTWFMIRVVATDEQLHNDQAEELKNGSLYIGKNGAPCSLDSAAIVDSRSLALAYIQCMPLWTSRKLKNAILATERFECELDEIKDNLCSTNWLGQIQSLMERHKVELQVG